MAAVYHLQVNLFEEDKFDLICFVQRIEQPHYLIVQIATVSLMHLSLASLKGGTPG